VLSHYCEIFRQHGKDKIIVAAIPYPFLDMITNFPPQVGLWKQFLYKSISQNLPDGLRHDK
jgi:hypothetical protein